MLRGTIVSSLSVGILALRELVGLTIAPMIGGLSLHLKLHVCLHVAATIVFATGLGPSWRTVFARSWLYPVVSQLVVERGAMVLRDMIVVMPL